MVLTNSDLIRSIFWRSVTAGDFFNIEHSREYGPSGGGGQRYIDIPIGGSLSPEALGRFLTGVGLGGDDSSWAEIHIEAISVGKVNSRGQLTFAPRRGGNRRYRIANQNRQSVSSSRHPAWTSLNGFPRAPDDVNSRNDARMPDLSYLKLIIAKDATGRFYASYVNRPSIPPSWPGNIGLEILFRTNASLRSDRMTDGVIPVPEEAILLPLDLISGMSSTESAEVSSDLVSDSIDIPVSWNAEFNPRSLVDARNRVMRSIVQRRGQPTFRQALLEAYGHRCLVSGCDFERALEAAHITPYRGAYTNTVANGLLLRADLHTLFDLHLFTIDYFAERVLVNPVLRGTHYDWLENHGVRFPDTPNLRPSLAAIKEHRAVAGL